MVEIGPKILATLLLPPGIILVGALLGFLIQIRWTLVGTTVVFLNFITLLILSLPLTGQRLMAGVESFHEPLRLTTVGESGPPPGAIIILGGGRYTAAPEYGSTDNVNPRTLMRMRYGAHLHRLTRLPVLVSGGRPHGEQFSEAELMRLFLEQDFRIDVKWVEDKSANTYENAKFSKELLMQAGVRRAYLVTDAVHMPRAVWSFERHGFPIIPAPTHYTTLHKEQREISGYLPSAYGLHLSSHALRERMGLIWYRRRYGDTEIGPVKAPVSAY